MSAGITPPLPGTWFERVQAVRDGRASATASIAHRLAHIEAEDQALGCFAELFPERAHGVAAAVDAAAVERRDAGPLAGLAFGVADNFDIAGRVTTAGSAVNRDRPPASVDALLVRRLERAGAILVGAQAMDEFGYGFTGENRRQGPLRNPIDPAHAAGGACGGGAAAVAAGLVDFALATDSIGSVRVPASFCGVFGLKPTYGRLPRSGTFPFVHELDDIGLFARTAADLALVYDAVQGHDESDNACVNLPGSPTMPHLDLPFAGRVGVLGGWFETLADEQGRRAVAAAAAALDARGEVILAGAAQARAAVYLLACASAGSLLFPELSTRPNDFEPGTRDRLLAGTLLPAHFVMQAQRYRSVFRDEVLAAFRAYDLLLAPATPCAAPRLRQATIRVAGEDVPTRTNLGLLTEPLSLVGLPIVAVPVPGAPLPIAVQLIAPPWREDLALAAAAHLERAGVVRSAAA